MIKIIKAFYTFSLTKLVLHFPKCATTYVSKHDFVLKKLTTKQKQNKNKIKVKQKQKAKYQKQSQMTSC